MKKVLFSDNNIWSLLNFRGEIIRHYIDKGYDVIVLAPVDDESEIQSVVPDGVRVIPVKMERTKTNPFSDIKYLFSVCKIYKREKPDYIFHYTIKPNIYGSIAARLNGIKSSAMMAGLGYTFRNSGLAALIGRLLYKIGLRYSDNVFLLNEDNVEEVLKRGICKKNKINLLRGGEGVNLKKFRYMDNEDTSITFVFIARMLFDKGYSEFVQCAKEIRQDYPDVKFELYGALDSGYPNAVPSSTIEEDERMGYVQYKGFTKDILYVFSRKGIVVMLPSYYGEGLNRTLMEACASGKPIITTNNPGCKETVRDGINGYIVEPQNTKQLIEAAKHYISLSEEEKNAMSLASRTIAEQVFDINRVIEEYDKLI